MTTIKTYYRYTPAGRKPLHKPLVTELPLQSTVNGQSLATLVCSPHQLNYLIAGFFYLQGFIESLDEILTLRICEDSTDVEAQLKTALPSELTPILTSGCGRGTVYNLSLPETLLQKQQDISTTSLFSLSQQLTEQAKHYQRHGGIHSAAVGDENGLCLYAEDIGRHNTLDRIAGESLFKGIDLRGKMLLSSGRISAEMAVKAAKLGLGLLASRTSPTEQAVEICAQAGICLIGYLRGRSFEVYTFAERLS